MSNVQKKKLVFGVIAVCAVMLVLGGLVYYKLCMDPYRGTVKNMEYALTAVGSWAFSAAANAAKSPANTNNSVEYFDRVIIFVVTVPF